MFLVYRHRFFVLLFLHLLQSIYLHSIQEAERIKGKVLYVGAEDDGLWDLRSEPVENIGGMAIYTPGC